MHAASPKGFAAVARDQAGAKLDLHDLMVPRPAATFFMRASGDAMAPFLCDGDLMVVDRSLAPRDGQVVVVSVDGRWIARRWEYEENLMPQGHDDAAEDHTRRAGNARPASPPSHAPGDHGRGVTLKADNPRYALLRARDVADFELFGVVTWVARKTAP